MSGKRTKRLKAWWLYGLGADPLGLGDLPWRTIKRRYSAAALPQFRGVALAKNLREPRAPQA